MEKIIDLFVLAYPKQHRIVDRKEIVSRDIFTTLHVQQLQIEHIELQNE